MTQLTVWSDPITAMQVAHPFLGPLMNAALSCLCESVSTIPNPPANCCFRVGTEVVHDLGLFEDLCCEGIAYVMLGELYPASEQFPRPDLVRQATGACAPATWAVYLKMGLIRCIPVGGVDPLSCFQWNNAAVQNVYDTMALSRAACCLRTFVVNEWDQIGMSVVIERQTQGNPSGGCIERSITFVTQIPNIECCP